MAVTEHAEVGVLEVVVVLEPVAHQPVDRDVSQPDQAESQNERPLLHHPRPMTRAGTGVVWAEL